MPDAPDFAKYLLGASRHSLQDLGELAARLGSPVRYDRRGNVIWFDDFRAGLAQWTISLSGTGAQAQIGTSYAELSGYNMRLTPGTTSSKYVICDRSLNPIELTKMGLEIEFGIATAFDTLFFGVYNYTGTQKQTFVASIDNATGTLWIRDNDGVYKSVASVGNLVDPYGIVHHLKLVINLKTRACVRLLFDKNEYNISSFSAYVTPQVSVTTFAVTVQIIGSGAASQLMLVNHAIVTIDEP